MNIIYSTQSTSLNLFYKTSLILKKKLDINKNIFLVSDSFFYNKWIKENKNIDKENNIFIKEWELFENLDPLDLKVLHKFERKIAKPGLMDALISDRRIFMGFRCTFTQDYNRRFNDEELLTILQKYLLEIDDIFLRYKPQISMSFVCVTLFDYLLYLFADYYNSKFLNIRPSKINNFVQISSDLIDPPSEIKSTFLNPKTINRNAVQFSESFLNKNISNSGIYEGIVKPSKRPAEKLQVKNNLLGFFIGFLLNIKNYYFSKSFRDNHCPNPLLIALYKYLLNPLRAFYTNIIFAKIYVRPSDLIDKDYAFFPMHTEPEVSLLVYSRPIINQIEIIRCIALSLPIGMKLVVKEHPWMIGKRKISAYKKLLNIPNVLISSPEVSTNNWIRNSNLVTIISSSVGQEAVFLGKPVLTFGNCMINMLPQTLVKKADALINLPDDIRNLIKNYTFNKQIIINYIASIISNTYPLNLYSSLLTRKSAFKYKKSDFNEDLEKFVQSILDKLDQI